MEKIKNINPLLLLLLLEAAALVTFGQKKDKIISRLTKIEERWHQAYVVHEPSVLAEILSDDFILVGRTGGRIGKDDVIKNLKADKSSYEYSTPYDMEFRIYKNCAIVLGKTKEKGVTEGKPFEANYFWKDIFIKNKNGWQCVLASTAKIDG
jgi:hypothetical protein